MAYHIPEEEALDRDALRELQRRRLAAMLDAILPANAFYRRRFDGLSFDAARDSLTDLPFTTREDIQADQAAHPPYGSRLTYPIDDYCRLHQTSGTMGRPLRCLDRAEDWEDWKRCWGIIFRAAGVTAADRFLFPFSFGPFIGFWAGFEGAVALGNLCLPAGGMSTEARLRFLIDQDVTFVACTPTYALRMAEVAVAEGIDLAGTAVRGLIVAGEPGGNIPAVRAKIESAWGARVFDHPGMSEVGPYGFECVESPGTVHVMETEFIEEVVAPETGRPVPEGDAGELVLTTLGRWGSPVIRYRTGDRVRVTRGCCRCGRSFTRMEGGLLGRYDDMMIIRGNNVFPAVIEGILREFVEVAEFRLRADVGGAMAQLTIEIEPTADAAVGALSDRIERAVRDRLHFKPLVRLVRAGSLPRFEMKARRVIRP